MSNIGQEKSRSPRLGGDRSLAAFVAIMSELDLAYPTFIANAVPGTRELGACPVGLPEDPHRYCRQMNGSR